MSTVAVVTAKRNSMALQKRSLVSLGLAEPESI